MASRERKQRLFVKSVAQLREVLSENLIKIYGPYEKEERKCWIFKACRKLKKTKTKKSKDFSKKYDGDGVNESTMNSPAVRLDFMMAALENFTNYECSPLKEFYVSDLELEDESMLVSAAAKVRRSGRLSGSKRELENLEDAFAELKKQKLLDELRLEQQARAEAKEREETMELEVLTYTNRFGLEPRLAESYS